MLCLRVLKQFSQKSKSSQFLHLNLAPLMGNIWQPSHLQTQRHACKFKEGFSCHVNTVSSHRGQQ